MSYIPSVLIPETMNIYKIPVLPLGKWYVYMTLSREQIASEVIPVNVNIEKFRPFWYEFGDIPLSELRNDRKLCSGWVDFLFSKSYIHPVDLPELGSIFDGKFRIRDGNTRIIWLITHGAQVFPIACPKEYHDDLVYLAGV